MKRFRNVVELKICHFKYSTEQSRRHCERAEASAAIHRPLSKVILDCFVTNVPRNDAVKKIAFTLAEVLITLGIIGVVAAMTIPTLMAKYQKYVTGIRVKKSYAVLLQAIKLSEAENGDLDGWDFGETNSSANTERFFNKYLLPHISGVTKCSVGRDNTCGRPAGGNGVNYRLNNGVGFSVLVETSTYVQAPLLSVIITPQPRGNNFEYITGRHSFTFDNLNPTGKLLPTGWIPNLSRTDIKEGYPNPYYSDKVFSCKEWTAGNHNVTSYYRHACTMLLMLDNWEFKNDYPWGK